jgi:uncharacterized protein YndB with AHSA1/START domain
MKPTDTGAKPTEAIPFELDGLHAPEDVWCALTQPELPAHWLFTWAVACVEARRAATEPC